MSSTSWSHDVPNSWVSNTTSQANCRDIITPTQEPQKPKKKSERNLFANSYSSCLKHLQSSMVRASHSLRHSIKASQTRHPSSPCFRNGWPFLGVYLIKCPTLCWKCLTWPAPTGRSLRTEKSFHFCKWQNITKTMPHSGKNHQNPAWFPKSQPHVSSKKSGPNKKDIWRKQIFLQRTWEPHLVQKKNDLWTSHFQPKTTSVSTNKPRRTPRDRIRIDGRETADDGAIRNHLAICGKPWDIRFEAKNGTLAPSRLAGKEASNSDNSSLWKNKHNWKAWRKLILL